MFEEITNKNWLLYALQNYDNPTLEKQEEFNDDGISHRKEGGLKLQVEYETLKTGMSKVYAKLV